MFGIIVSVPRKYEEYALATLSKLRHRWKVECPIEVWEIGKEVSEATRQALTTLGGVQFRDIGDFTSNPGHWKGYQSKAFAAQHTAFDEFLLFDADVSFFQNPLVVHQDPGYQSTGTFLFRDQWRWRFRKSLKANPKHKWESLEYFRGRKDFLRELFPTKPLYWPREWDFFFEEGLPNRSVPEAYMEAGVIYIDKKRHQDSVEWNYRLNEDHKKTYEFMWGDKDTWWMGCCLCGKPHTINKTYPLSSPPLIRKVLPQLTHFYRGRPFFGQK